MNPSPTMPGEMAMTPDDLEAIARKRAGAKLGWYLHAAVFVGVNLFLYVSSTYGLRARPFGWAPFAGWGVGLALHGISVFVLAQGSSLRERLVRRERERLERERRGG